jgi:hypothetical protein
MIKSMTMRGAEHMARMGEKRIAYRESQSERVHQEDQEGKGEVKV